MSSSLLLRRRASAPFLALRRRCVHSSSGSPVPLPRCLASSSSSPSSGIVSWLPRRFLASSPSPLASTKISADENLKRVIDSEIDCVVHPQEPSSQQLDLPEDFPFEIIDNPGDQSITLKREFAGETIKAIIYTNFDDEENMDEDDNDADDDNSEDSFNPAVQMVVSIEKQEGPILEFCCNFNDNELGIENMKMLNRDNPDAENVYEGPEFSILDENLQKALHKYLEVRGIKHSLHDWLYEYMINKDEREYVVWLKNMKEFIGK